jgi:hypothetical protein
MTSGMVGRRYLDPGDRMTGRYDPPRPCRVLVRWRPGGGGPRNVLVEYTDGGRQSVIPFPRRLRRDP